MGQEDGPGFSPSGPAWRHQAEPKEDRGLLENWDLSIEHRTGVRTPLVRSQNSGSPCTQAALSPKGWKNEVLLGLVDSFPPHSEALMVGTLSSAFPGLSKLQLPTDKVRVSKFTVSGLRVVELHTTSGAGAPGAGPYAFAPVHPKLCLASFLPLGVPAPTFPRRAGRGCLGPPRRAGASQPAPAWRSRGEPSGQEGREKCRRSRPS